jgi:dipeptidyl-peptidase-4
VKKSLSTLLLFTVALACSAQQKLTLEEAVTGQFRQFAPRTLDQLQWLPASDAYVYVQDTALVHTTSRGAASTLFTLEELNQWKGGAALPAMPQLNWMDGLRFWFTHEGNYFEGDIKSRSVRPVLSAGSNVANEAFHAASGRLAYTRDNNLYTLAGDKEAAVTQLPAGQTAGQSVSRNEYGISQGIFWNGKGDKIAFYQKNESQVADYPVTQFSTLPATAKNIRYPMAGGQSEHVSVGIYNVISGHTVYVQTPEGLSGDQFYLTNLAWDPSGTSLYIAWLNRDTNLMKLMCFDAATGAFVRTLFTESDEQWCEPEQPVHFIPGHPREFLWFSRRDGFNNLYHYNTDGVLLGATAASFEIDDIIGFDAQGNSVFVHARGIRPTEVHIYSISLSAMKMSVCGTVPGVHRGQLSGSGKFLLDTYSSLDVPNNTDLINTSGQVVRSLLSSPNPLKEKRYGQTELFTVKTADGSERWCRLIKPSNFNPARRYPVLVYVYNGPHVQLVTNNWLGGASLWMNYFAEEGYLVFTLDGRGSAHRGEAFEQAIYRQLGTAELEDQLAGVAWLKQQSFVDSTRMAVHGWSFGGFMTTALMLKAPGTFKAGVAGGAVIDWNLYEVMYTERYMDTPVQNPSGYTDADLSRYVKNLQGKLLMIHGMDDDVVVLQHHMRFVKACVDNKVQIETFLYPGHAHNVRGKDRVHLIRQVLDYVTANL